MMRYIEIVGLDGAGKSSLCRVLKWNLGVRSCMLHVPNNKLHTSQVVHFASQHSVSPLSRVLTYMAAYSEVYDIFKSNDTGIDYLIGDRGYACFSAYHTECSEDVIDSLWSIAMRGLFPHLLVFIDTPVEICQARIARRRYPSEIDTML